MLDQRSSDVISVQMICWVKTVVHMVKSLKPKELVCFYSVTSEISVVNAFKVKGFVGRARIRYLEAMKIYQGLWFNLTQEQRLHHRGTGNTEETHNVFWVTKR